MWLMNGSTISSSATPTYQGSAVSPDASWNIVEIGDFNGSGDSDILWQQSTTGALVEWQMNGSQIVSSQTVTSQGDSGRTQQHMDITGEAYRLCLTGHACDRRAAQRLRLVGDCGHRSLDSCAKQ